MLLEKTYIINAEYLQELIMTNLYFMHSYYHEYTQSKEEIKKERAYVFYRMYRAKLKEMIRLQGLSNEEWSMVQGYLMDLEDAILNGTYKLH